jgi:sugar lactone lactonase YvrE
MDMRQIKIMCKSALVLLLGLTGQYLGAQVLPQNVQSGVQWLQAQVTAQGQIINDGASLALPWQSQSETAQTLQLLATVTDALANRVTSTPSYGLSEIDARKLLLASALQQDTLTALATLTAARSQYSPSAWGANRYWTANALDTSYALLAIKASKTTDSSLYTPALQALKAMQLANGAFDINEQSSVFTTAYALTALSSFHNALDLADAMTQANSYLLSVRVNGSFGNTLDNALALTALMSRSNEKAILNPIVQAIESAQLANGSWADDAYVTAIVLRALYRFKTDLPLANLATVQGATIDDTTGRAVLGVTVQAIGAQTTVVSSLVNGNFLISNQAPGAYTLRFAKAGYLSKEHPITLTANQVLNVGDIRLVPAPLSASLSGLVSEANGQPVNGANVSVTTSFTLTTANGQYSLPGLNPEPSMIKVIYLNFEPITASMVFEAGKSYFFSPTFYNWPIPTEVSLKGIVVDSVTLAPIDRAIVALATQKQTTPAAGTFSFGNLASGGVSLEVSAAGYISKRVDGLLARGDNNAGQISLVKALNTSRVFGKITDSSTGNVVPNVAIQILGQAVSGQSDAAGLYSLPGVQGNLVRLDVSAPGYLGQLIEVSWQGSGEVKYDFQMLAIGQSGLEIDRIAMSKASYLPDEEIKLTVSLRNSQVQAASVLLEADVVNAQGTVVFTFMANAHTIWAGARGPNEPIAVPSSASKAFEMEWYTLRQAAGNYQVKARAIDAIGRVVAEGQTSFSVQATAVLRGGLTANPPLVSYGTNQPVALTADISNSGNVDLSARELDLKITLQAADPEFLPKHQFNIKKITEGSPLNYSVGLVKDSVGNVYTANGGDGKLIKIDTQGVMSVLAVLPRPWATGLAIDSSDTLWVTGGYSEFYQVSQQGIVTTHQLTTLNTTSAIDIEPSGAQVFVGNYSNESRLVRRTLVGVETVLWRNGLASPFGLVDDGAGNWVVSNMNDGTLVKVAKTDGTIATFASGLESPRGITRGTDGSFYVTEMNAGRIIKVAPDGQKSTYASNLNTPYDLAFNSLGDLYVTSQYDNSVVVVKPNGTVEPFSRGIALRPKNLRFDANGDLWNISDDGSLRKSNAAGVSTVIATGLFNAKGLAINPAGTAFVADINGGTVKRIDNGAVSNHATGLQYPIALALGAADELWVAEASSSKLKRLDAQGQVIEQIESVLNNPSHIARSANDDLFVLSSSFVALIQSTGQKVLSRSSGMYSYQALTYSPLHNAALVTHGYEIKSLDLNGVTNTIATLPDYPQTIAIDALGAIYYTGYGFSGLKKMDTQGVVTLAVPSNSFYVAKVFNDAIGNVFLTTYDKRAYTVAADNTTAEIGSSVTAYSANAWSIASNGNMQVVAADGIYEVNKVSGVASKSVNKTFPDFSGFVSLASGQFAFIRSSESELTRYDTQGAVLQTVNGYREIKDMVRSANSIFLVDDWGSLLEMVGGQYPIKRANDFGSYYTASLDAFNGSVYASKQTGISQWDGQQVTSHPISGAKKLASIAATSNKIATYDEQTHQVIVLDNQWAVSANYAGLEQPSGLTFDASDNLYVVNYGASNVVKFLAGNKTPIAFAKTNHEISNIAVAPDGTFWLSGPVFVYQITAQGVVISENRPKTVTSSFSGMKLDNGRLIVVDDTSNRLLIIEGDTVVELASGMVSPSAVKAVSDGQYRLGNSRNGTVTLYSNNTMRFISGGHGVISSLANRDAISYYVGNRNGGMSYVEGGKVTHMNIESSILNNSILGMQLMREGSLFAITRNQYSTQADLLYEVKHARPVVTPPVDTLVFTTKVPLSRLAVNGRSVLLNLANWLPPFPGDFRIELTGLGVAGGVINFLHVGTDMQAKLATNQAMLPPGNQIAQVCMDLKGGDFTKLTKIEVPKLKQLARVNFFQLGTPGAPKGLATSVDKRLYYTTQGAIFVATDAYSTGTPILTGLDLGFGLAIDRNDFIYVLDKSIGSQFDLVKVSTKGVVQWRLPLGVSIANGIVLDDEGNLTIAGENILLIVDPQKNIKVRTVTGMAVPHGITLGLNGDIYYQTLYSQIGRHKSDGTTEVFFDKGDGTIDPLLEGDGSPTIASDCSGNVIFSPISWLNVNDANGATGEEHIIYQYNPLTRKVLTVVDFQLVDPSMQDIDYVTYDRLNKQYLLFNHGNNQIFTIPVTCGALNLQANLFSKPGQQLSGFSKAPSATIPQADGRTQYVWQLKDVDSAGQQVCFNAPQSNLLLGETRPVIESGYVAFQNTFAPEDVKVPIQVPEVSVGNLVALTVTTDKPDYNVNGQALISTVLRNTNAYAVAGDLTVEVFDLQGVRLGAVNQQRVLLPAQATQLGELTVSGVFPIGVLLPLQYRVKATLTDLGSPLAKGETPFVVLADNVSGSAISSLATDKQVYNANDQVNIASRAFSQSLNVRLDNLTLMVKVYDPQGQLMLSNGHVVAQLLPGANRDFSLPQRLRNALPGDYKVTQTLTDAQGRVYDTHESTYRVSSAADTGFGLLGTIAATPKTVRIGELLNLASTVSNTGNATLSNLNLKVVLLDPVQGTVLQEYPTTLASLPNSGSAALPASTWHASGPVNTTYLAVLLATIGTTQTTLAADTFTVLPQIATTIRATAGTPQAMTITKAYNDVLEATVLDTVGSPFVGATVTFTAPASGASVSFPNGNTAVTDSFGRARVAVVANNATGDFTLTASTPNALPSPASDSADFNLTNLAPQAAQIKVYSGTPQTALVTQTYSQLLTAIVINNLGQPMPNATVTFVAPAAPNASVSFLTSATTVTDINGYATVQVKASSVAGALQVAATTPNAAGSALFNLTNRPALAASIEYVSGSNQSATITQNFAQPLVVRVKDELGVAMPGVLASFVAPASGASASFTSAQSITTNAQGLATVSIAANAVDGNYNLTASAAGVGGSVTFVLSNKLPVATSITYTSGSPQSATASTAFSQLLVATVRDNLGSLMPNIVVNFGPKSGNFAANDPSFPNGNTALTGANGQASIVIKAGSNLGLFAVAASAPGVSGSADYSLTVVAPITNQLSYQSGSPQTAILGQDFAQTLAVSVKNSLNQAVKDVLVKFTAPASGAGVQFVSGDTALTDINGNASVQVKANNTAGAYTVQATASTGPITASGQTTFQLQNRAALAQSISYVSGSPQSVTAALDFPQALTVVVKDELGRVMPGVAVSFAGKGRALAANDPVLLGNNPSNTDSNGLASIFVKAGSTIAPYTLTATAANVVGAVDFNLTVTALPCGRANAVQFTPLTRVELLAAVESNTVTVTGLGAGCSAAASIRQGSYKITRAGQIISKLAPGFSTQNHSVQDGDSITLAQTASSLTLTTTIATLTLDGVASPWVVTTTEAETIAKVVSLWPQSEPQRSLALLLLALLLWAAVWLNLKKRGN